MEENKQYQTETVAPAQPFLNAEKEQMEQLQQKAHESGEVTQMSATEAVSAVSALTGMSPEVQAQLNELAAIKAAQKAEQEPKKETGEVKPQVSDIPPEVQAQLDELAALKEAEKSEQEEQEKDPDYVKFAKPYKFEGKEYKGIKLEFDEMTGADILEAEEEFIQTKTQTAAQTPLKELSKGYLAFFAARACAQPVDFILGLDGKSFAKITRKAQSFLLAED